MIYSHFRFYRILNELMVSMDVSFQEIDKVQRQKRAEGRIYKWNGKCDETQIIHTWFVMISLVGLNCNSRVLNCGK